MWGEAGSALAHARVMRCRVLFCGYVDGVLLGREGLLVLLPGLFCFVMYFLFKCCGLVLLCAYCIPSAGSV